MKFLLFIINKSRRKKNKIIYEIEKKLKKIYSCVILTWKK